jgi:hypothetical protein
MFSKLFFCRSVLLSVLLLNYLLAQAADYIETLQGELSDDRLNPSFLALTYGAVGANGLAGNNIVSGTVGRSAITGVIDRDYLHIVVPAGFVLSELRVGNQTNVGGTASFIGIATGSVMPVLPTASNAAGLLGYKLYNAADLTQNILDDMAVSDNGPSGFASVLGAGDYTLWVQELATGNFNYRFNLIIAQVPETESYAILLAGLGYMGAAARKKLHKDSK